MTGVSMKATSIGSNVNGPDFDTTSTLKNTTAQDGQYDVMYKNFTAISRTSTSVTTVLDNTINLVASMKVGVTQHTITIIFRPTIFRVTIFNLGILIFANTP